MHHFWRLNPVPRPEGTNREELNIGEDAHHEKGKTLDITQEVLNIRRTINEHQRDDKHHNGEAAADNPSARRSRRREGSRVLNRIG